MHHTLLDNTVVSAALVFFSGKPLYTFLVSGNQYCDWLLLIIACIVFAIGYLCPGSESEHIQPGSRLELPLWMARSLCSRRRHIATVEVPRPYRSGHRKILDADAAVVDLHKFCPYYYSVGTRLLAFELAESTDIARLLLLVLLLFFSIVFFLVSILPDVQAVWMHHSASDTW